MKDAMLFLGMLLVGAGIACGQAAHPTATAELHNAKGEKVGNATLNQADEGVKISLTGTNLPPGTHALHIHGVGKCDPPDFKTAGPHFNPYNKKHGTKNPDGAHVGDLPNVTVGADGTASTVVVAKNVTLGEGTNSLFHPEGTALVIHAAPDDDMTDPAGNAGARIACGVITAQ